MAHEYKDPNVGISLENIMDTFSGADNEAFYHLLMAIREFDLRSANGDEAATKLLKIMLDFSRLIDVLKKTGNKVT